MSLYGIRQLGDGFRTVRRNTIQLAEEIPESKYDYRPAPPSRSVAETLVHIAWLGSADRFMAMGRIDTELPGKRGVVVDWCRQSAFAGEWYEQADGNGAFVWQQKK